MKRKVILSTWCAILTMITFIILVALLAFTYVEGTSSQFLFFNGFIIVIVLVSLFYVPMSISVDEKGLTVNRSLWHKYIPIAEIEEIRLCPPTMGETRLCGSGGFMGHWGWFKERDLGIYFAYYGRSSDCFLVRLRNGRQYILGCSQPQDIVDYVNNAIQKRGK